jgi:Lipid-A-disaccharide synthetase
VVLFSFHYQPRGGRFPERGERDTGDLPVPSGLPYNPGVMLAPAELLIVSSGPGEVSTWAVPMGRAAAAWAAARGQPLTLSLILPPCQFASGQEAAFARRQGVFARVLGPRDCLAVVTGLRRLALAGPGCVLHLGGDLWYSSTLGRRLGVPAFAYVETTLIRKRAHRFARVFVPTQDLAGRLLSDGVRKNQILTVGDLRVDALTQARPRVRGTRTGARVALFPGSRRWIVQGFLPFLLGVAGVIRRRRPDVAFSLVASPFLPRDVQRAVLDAHRADMDRLEITIVDGDDLGAAASADLAITLPGTNTVQLAVLGIPMLVVVPLNRPERIRTEGLSEWIARVPGLGTVIKGIMARRFLRQHEPVAWPNREAGRMIVPEMVGRLDPGAVAERALAMLDNRGALDATAQALRELYRTPSGVAERMLDAMAGSVAAPAAAGARVKAGAATA